MTQSVIDSFHSLSIDSIVIRDDKLREVRDKDYIDRLARTIESAGTIYQPLTVIRHPEEEDKYILSDGLHRLTAAKELGWGEVPCIILDIPQEDLNWQQIIANEVRKPNSRLEVAQTLQRIMATDKYSGLTTKQLLDKLGLDKSPSWLENQLKLNNLIPEMALLVEQGKITVSNASWLGRLPADEQIKYRESAINEAPNDFVATVQMRLKELKAESQGKSKESIDPLSKAKLRSKTEIKSKFVETEEQSKQNPDDLYLSGFYQGLAYAIRMDAETMEAERLKKEEAKRLEEQFAQERNEMLNRHKAIAEEQARKRQEALAAEQAGN